MELIKNFGIEPVLLVAQVINFLIVLYILKRFLYKPILELLQKRQNSIKEGIEKTKEAQKRLEKIITEEKTILKNAKAYAQKIINNATHQSLEASKAIQENAKKQSENILKEARLQILREAKASEKRLMENVSFLAIKFLQKSAEQLFSVRQQKEVMENALKKIKV